MQMVILCFDLVIMLLAIEVHQIEFVDHAQLLKQLDGSVNRRAIDIGITLAGLPQQARCVKMRRCLLDGFDQCATLRRQPYTASFHLTQQFITREQSSSP